MPRDYNKSERINISVHLNDESRVGRNSLPIPLELISRIQINESINEFIPTFEIGFTDIDGLFQENFGFADIDIIIETYNEKLDGQRVLIFNGIVLSQPEVGSKFAMDLGRQERLYRGVHREAIELIGEAQRKSYEGTTSDIFREIIGLQFEATLSEEYFLIEESQDNPRCYINPGWTNGQFIKYLSDRAISQRSVGIDGIGGYLSWFDLTYTLGNIGNENLKYLEHIRPCFVSPSYLIERDYVTKDILITQVPELVERAFQNDGRVEVADGVNKYIGLGFSSKYQTAMNFNYYSRKSAYFDIENRKYQILDYKFNNGNNGSEWFPELSKNQNNENKKLYDPVLKNIDKVSRIVNMGSETEIEARALRYNDIHRNLFNRYMNVMVLGTSSIQIGDKIKTELYLPNPENPKSYNISSEWIVTRKTHLLSLPTRIYTVKLELGTNEYRQQQGT